MRDGWRELRTSVVVGATSLLLVAACEDNSSESARGELGRAVELPWGNSGVTDLPGGQAAAPFASFEAGSGGNLGEDATSALDEARDAAVGNSFNGQAGAPFASSEAGSGGSRHDEDATSELDEARNEAIGDSLSGQADAPFASSEAGSGGSRHGEDGTSEPDGGSGGATGELACDRIADIVPTTCPSGSPSGAYRETGLGFLEITGLPPNAHQTPWAPVSDARAINAAGDVVGYATLCDRTRAILYRAGTLLELDPIPGAIRSFAWDINDEGDVLGEADDAVFLWKDGVATVLDGVGMGGGIAINNLGQVLGMDQGGAFIWDAGLVTRLELDEDARVTDLNDHGQVTGHHEYGDLGAFVWEDGVVTPLPPLPGAKRSRAWAINEAGQVVGSSMKEGVGRAVLWSAGLPVDITPPTAYRLLESAGLDINERGVVLGHFQEDGPRENSAGFVFDHGVTTIILPEDPTVGAALSPSALNDSGQIAGTTLFWTGSPNQATVWSRGCFSSCCN